MAMQSNNRRRNLARYIPLLLMSLPGALYLFINNYIPLFGIVVAFKDYRQSEGLWGSKWVGLDNFQFLFKSPVLGRIVRNTLLYNAAFIVLSTAVAVLLAIIMNELRSKMAVRVFQMSVLLPYIISMVLVGYVVYGFLHPQNGFMNMTILPALGLDPVSWYNTPGPWVFILPIVYLWKNVGFSTIIYFASIVGIDPELFDAAKVDGASKWKQIRFITLPFLIPTISIMGILAVGRIFSADFGLFYQVPMNSSAIYSSTQVVETYVYEALMRIRDIGMSSSVGVLQSVVGCVLLLSANWIIGRINKDNTLL